MEREVYHVSAETLAVATARRVARLLEQAIAARGKATLALSGGRTPGPFMTTLGTLDVDWSRVQVTLTDERCVSPEDDRSNARLVAETLMAGPARRASFVSLFSGADSLDAADAVARMLPLDVAVFGMGEDYHTASLFPDGDGTAAALSPDAPSPLALIRAPSQPEPRITLTAPAILTTCYRILLLAGTEKVNAYRRARAIGDTRQAPVNILFLGMGETEVRSAP